MSDKKTVVITSAARTAIGSLSGTLKNVPAHEMGSAIISDVIKVVWACTKLIVKMMLKGGEGLYYGTKWSISFSPILLERNHIHLNHTLPTDPVLASNNDEVPFL